jgi:hypothetical protein
MTDAAAERAREHESVARAADYVAAVLEAVDDLPVVFLQRRSRTWFGRITMPGNRQLTQMFVRRQLAQTVGRLKSETGLSETAVNGKSQGADRLSVLVEAAGTRSSAVVPIILVLGTIGLMVSLLSIGLPSLQQEADLLGSFPRVVTLDGASVADSATAFDDNASIFSPQDLVGVVTSLLLGAMVVWGLFSVLAGSAHAAMAILDDPWRYDRNAPFQPSVRRGPVPTQRATFGARPRRIHTPIGADLIRDAAFYTVLAGAYLRALIGVVVEEGDNVLVDYWRVGAASAIWLSGVVVFPLVILGAYLVIRHRRASDGSALPPPRGWRVALGTLLAAATCFVFVGGTTSLFDVRLTTSADLLVTRDYWLDTDGSVVAVRDGNDTVLGADYFEDDLYLTNEVLDCFQEIEDLRTQSISYYVADVFQSGGSFKADLLVTELDTASEFLGADIDDNALRQLKSSSTDGADELPDVWISNGLAASLDPQQGDTIEFEIFEGQRLSARASAVFVTPNSTNPVIVLDVEDFRTTDERLLIDEILIRAEGGPLHDDSDAMRAVDETLEWANGGSLPDDCLAITGSDDQETRVDVATIDVTKIDLRQELVPNKGVGILYLILVPVLGFAAVVVAFGRPSTWGGTVTGLAAPAISPDAVTTDLVVADEPGAPQDSDEPSDAIGAVRSSQPPTRPQG